MRTRILLIIGIVVIAAVLLVAAPLLDRQSRAAAAPNEPLSPDVFATPIQAGCYIAAPNDCRIHIEPFTITVNSGSHLVFFSLVTFQQGTGTQRLIHNFKPDLSNPVPLSGTTFTPSLVTQDYAATCGLAYSVNLQAQDTLDPNPYSVGLTGYFTCPSTAP